jgi:uncharacterized membrane protein
MVSAFLGTVVLEAASPIVWIIVIIVILIILGALFGRRRG